ncbi:ABC transporter ATP-binding protein [Sporosarcina sp. A2]|uniref:ABC transporter ATP-binding protein n=1 Tax=Sporosarcina sp. A2 TaxID=3393449 RepID=UPI003D78C775
MKDGRTNHQNTAFSIEKLRLKFPGEDSLIFKDLSISVEKGEKVLLLGPSGCGKSTLLQVASGIVPNSFELPMKAETLKLPNSWGFVFQDPDTQFCMPYVDEELAFVLENLNVPREDMRTLIDAVLQRVGLHMTDIHTSISELSQGMKQRLALASVLLMEPDVLFLDEPSALLDPEGTKQIWDSIQAATAEQTVVIVEHKIEQIAGWIDRVVLFNDDGEILADGLPESIFNDFKDELIQYGIWYPGVWNDYLNSDAYRTLSEERSPSTALEVLHGEYFNGYRGKKSVIHVANASITKGSWVTILGENGSGKSSLLLSFMQLLKTSGTLEVNGNQITQKKRRKVLPTGLSLVFQNPELQFVTNSIIEELTISLQGISSTESTQHAEDMVKLFNLPASENRHPYQLSIGQKRRLSVATALTSTTDILLLDEPTFGQDARNTFAILEKLEALRTNGMTIVMVTHDLEIAAHFATDLWKVVDGRLVSCTRQGGVNDAQLVYA